jgi:predicted transcriptional regulator
MPASVAVTVPINYIVCKCQALVPYENIRLLTNAFVYNSPEMAKLPKPTDAELAILRVLWQRGPSTVRQVHDALNATKKTGYTTVLKFLQIMHEKGLVSRDEAPYAHVYQARLPREEAQRTLVADLLNRAFEGSMSGLVLQALSSKKASKEELSQIRKVLRDYERGVK